jgi:hypothetical protein
VLEAAARSSILNSNWTISISHPATTTRSTAR